METSIKINSLNGIIVDFGDYDVNQAVQSIKERYIADFHTKRRSHEKKTEEYLDSNIKSSKGASALNNLFKEWLELTQAHVFYDTEDLETSQELHYLFNDCVLLSAIQLRGLKEWQNPFF